MAHEIRGVDAENYAYKACAEEFFEKQSYFLVCFWNKYFYNVC